MAASRATDEIELIRELLRSAGVPAEPIRGEPTEADERALAAVLSGGSPARPAGFRARRAWRRPAVRAVAAAATVVAAVAAGIAWQGGGTPAAAGTVPLLPFSDGDLLSVQAGGGTPARTVLDHLAAVAAAQPVPAAEGRQEISSYAWFVASTTDADGTTESVLAPMYQTMEVSPDGSAVNRVVQGPALDRDGRIIDGRYPPGGPQSTDEFPPGSVDPQRAQLLPRDPAALRTALLAPLEGFGCGANAGTTADCLVRQFVEVQNTAVVPPDLTAAMWRVLAAEPAVVTLGETTDRLGRPGVAVAFDTGLDVPRAVKVLIISPDDGRLLQWEDVLTDDPERGVDSPAVHGFQVYLSSEWVARR